MQFLDNDNSEWVRKAADDYPVKPFGMNWDAVAKQLQEEEPVKKVDGYALFRYAAMIIFFMLLSLVLNKYLRLDFDKRYAATSAYDQQQESKVPDMAVKTTNRQKGYSGSVVNGGSDSWKQQGVYSHLQISEGNDFNIPNTEAQMSLSGRVPISFIDGLPDRDHGIAYKQDITLSQAQVDLLSKDGLKKEEHTESVSVETQAEKNVPLKKGGFYVGMVMGPDFSSVKFQKTNGMGYNLGIILGYKLSSRWQLESGVLLNRKSYYSNGEYFNAAKTYLPTHAYVTKVDGYCNMFEVPLNIRYNIVQKKQANWFATAGVSSYLMNKEDYNITYKRYNVEYNGNKVYYNGVNNWLTALNASVGYEKAIHQKLQLRVEPYLKLPLQGMGTGKLPISSGGLNLGVSYSIK